MAHLIPPLGNTENHILTRFLQTLVPTDLQAPSSSGVWRKAWEHPWLLTSVANDVVQHHQPLKLQQ